MHICLFASLCMQTIMLPFISLLGGKEFLVLKEIGACHFYEECCLFFFASLSANHFSFSLELFCHRR